MERRLSTKPFDITKWAESGGGKSRIGKRCDFCRTASPEATKDLDTLIAKIDKTAEAGEALPVTLVALWRVFQEQHGFKSSMGSFRNHITVCLGRRSLHNA